MTELDLPDYAIRFFAAFARFEFAVKSAGHVAINGNRVITNWDGFADRPEIAGLLTELAENAATQYLVLYPPKKQIVDQGRLDWGPAPPAAADMRELMVMLRRVRNNLPRLETWGWN